MWTHNVEQGSSTDSAYAQTKSRPVIYICHSLGGIVFKQAMNVAFEKYYEVWERSKGVIFLGTPHRGSTPADLAALLGDIANAVLSAPGPHLLGGGVSTSLLRTLKANSEELNGISDVFTQRAGALAIETFFETYTTSPIGDVVSSISYCESGLILTACLFIELLSTI